MKKFTNFSISNILGSKTDLDESRDSVFGKFFRSIFSINSSIFFIYLIFEFTRKHGKQCKISGKYRIHWNQTLIVNRSTVAHWYVICFSPGRSGFKSRQGTIFQNKKNVTFELLRCSYSHICWIYEPSIGIVHDIKGI